MSIGLRNHKDNNISDDSWLYILATEHNDDEATVQYDDKHKDMITHEPREWQDWDHCWDAIQSML